MAGNRTENVRDITATERQRQATELRLAGASLTDIADQLGYANASSAKKAIAAALRKTLTPPSDEMRQLELERLDRVILAIWQRATQRGELPAIDRLLKAIDQRSRLLGLYAPLRLNWTIMVKDVAGTLGLSDDETKILHHDIAKYLAEAQAGATTNH